MLEASFAGAALGARAVAATFSTNSRALEAPLAGAAFGATGSTTLGACIAIGARIGRGSPDWASRGTLIAAAARSLRAGGASIFTTHSRLVALAARRPSFCAAIFTASARFFGTLRNGDTRHLRVGLYLNLPGFSARRADTLRHAKIAFEDDEFVEAQVTPLTWAQIFRRHPGVRDARQTHHERSGCFTETTHLAVAPFAQRELEPSLVAFVA